MAFAGLAYLVWSLVAGVSRQLMQEMIDHTSGVALEPATGAVKIFFVDAGFIIDLVGVLWLVAALVLILLSSRQRISISWAWMCAAAQSIVAALGGVLVCWAIQRPYVAVLSKEHAEQALTAPAQLSMITLPIIIPIAILIWVTFLVWLLVERARLSRHGPTLSDGLRTNVYR